MQQINEAQLLKGFNNYELAENSKKIILSHA